MYSDGWYLRSEITWCKTSPMPESVTDRPTSSTEKIFLFTKSSKYLYNADAVRNPPSEAMLKQVSEGYNGEALKGFEANGVQNASDVKSRIINGARARIDKQRGHIRRHDGFNDRWDHLTKAEQMACGSNMRNYWLLGPEPYIGEHYATFPSEIPKRAILAGSNSGDTVLDPFFGSGTTGMVALELGRKCIGVELYAENVVQANDRCNVTPGLAL
jgi:DNA modification methylase